MWRQACVLAGSFALTAPALAMDPASGWYTGFNLGFHDSGKVYTDASLELTDTSWQIFTPTPLPSPMVNSVVNFNPGGFTSLFLGYRFTPELHVDTQFEYAYSSITDLSNPEFGHLDGGFPGYAFSGRHTHLVAFLNFLYDFSSVYKNTGHDPTWVPYAGVGIGAGRFRDSYTFASDTLEAVLRYTQNRTAAQGIVGFNYYLDSYTNFFIDYRYQSTIGHVIDLGKRYSVNTLGFGVMFNLSNT